MKKKVAFQCLPGPHIHMKKKCLKGVNWNKKAPCIRYPRRKTLSEPINIKQLFTATIRVFKRKNLQLEQ